MQSLAAIFRHHMNNKLLVSVCTYHEYLLEAILTLKYGLTIKDIRGHIYCRYSFLLIANSLETAANALLHSLELDKDYYDELEKLNTLLKFKTYCNFKGKKLDTGNVKVARLKEIIACRNEFVHPKPKKVDYDINFEKGEFDFKVTKTKIRQYPHYFSAINPQHTLFALEDTLSFISWICFDICKLSIQRGALYLGLGSISKTSDLEILGKETGIKFDTRSFGN